ncbi:atp-dependent dna helicase pif1, partial [Vairimorpha ceranae]
NFLVCKILTGHKKNSIVAIPRIDLSPSETTLPFRLKRRLFPIIPAFAMTIHKAQGQSYGRVGIYLPEPLFTHGQLYVALSRVRNKDQLRIEMSANSNNCVDNIVYKELL